MTSRQKKQVIHSLFTVVFVVTLGFSIVNPFFPVYMKTLTGQGLLIALAFSGFSLSKMIFTPLLCRWSDFGKRRLFIASGLAIHTVAAFFFCFLPENIYLILVLRFFQGAATAMVRPIAQAYVGTFSAEKREGSSMGAFDVSFYAALGMGPILGGMIGDSLGYRGMFLVLLVLCFAALLIAFTCVTPENKDDVKTKMGAGQGKGLFRNRLLQGLYVFIFTRSFGIIIVPIFLPLLLHSYFRASYFEIGVCIAVSSITTALLLRPLGRLSDSLNRKMLVTVGGVLSGLLTIGLPLAHSFGQVMILSVALSFFSTLSLPASSAVLIEEGRRHGMGYTMGVSYTVLNIGFFVGPLIAGLLMDYLGINSVFYLAGLFGIAGAMFFGIRGFQSNMKRIVFVNNMNADQHHSVYK